MVDDNATLEKYYLEYTMEADSVKISKYPAYTSEKYKSRRERLIIVDTIFNYQVEVFDGKGYRMNFYFSHWEDMDSCVISFPDSVSLEAYLEQYLNLTCAYQWLYLNDSTYIQTDYWALKTSELDANGEKRRLTGSRVLQLRWSPPVNMKVSIPLMDEDLWKETIKDSP